MIATKLERIGNWLSKSGMKVNESKTSLCLFFSRDTTPIEIVFNGSIIRSKTSINVLGVIFDQKLQWSDQIANCVTKSSKSLVAIKMLKFFFNTTELLTFVTSNYYSVLYYNSEIWHLPSLRSNLKQKLLSSSSGAIRACVKYCTRNISFENLHAMYHRATPEKILLYKSAISLYKLYNYEDLSIEWVSLNVNQILTSRQTKFVISKAHTKKVGINALANRLYILNNKIPLNWLNFSYVTFKLYCKKEFLLF